MGIDIHVTAVGHIINLPALLCRNNANIAIRVVAVGNERQGKPIAVRRPFIREGTAGIRAVMLRTIGNLAHFAGFQVQHFQQAPVLYKSDFLAIRRKRRRGTLHTVLKQGLLLYQGCMRKIHVLRTHARRFVEVPHSRAATGIHQCLPVRRDGHAHFRFRRMGDLLYRPVFFRNDKDFAPVDDCHVIPLVGQSIIGSPPKGQGFQLLFLKVIDNLNLHFLRLTAFRQRIDFPLITETKRTVVRTSQETHGMLLESGQRLGMVHVLRIRPVHIKRTAITLTEEHHAPVRQINRRTVLPRIGSQKGVGIFLRIIIKNVPGNGGSVVLAPYILAAGAVFVNERFPVLGKREVADGRCQHLFRASTFHRDAVQLCNPGIGKQGTACGVLYRRREIDVTVVR